MIHFQYLHLNSSVLWLKYGFCLCNQVRIKTLFEKCYIWRFGAKFGPEFGQNGKEWLFALQFWILMSHNWFWCCFYIPNQIQIEILYSWGSWTKIWGRFGSTIVKSGYFQGFYFISLDIKFHNWNLCTDS